MDSWNIWRGITDRKIIKRKGGIERHFFRMESEVTSFLIKSMKPKSWKTDSVRQAEFLNYIFFFWCQLFRKIYFSKIHHHFKISISEKLKHPSQIARYIWMKTSIINKYKNFKYSSRFGFLLHKVNTGWNSARRTVLCNQESLSHCRTKNLNSQVGLH